MNIEEINVFLKEAESRGSVLGLSNMEILMEALGHPENKLKVIHITGTNGKGSTACYISNILVSAGFHTGLYSSPAVFSPFEIYKIDNEPISEEIYLKYMSLVKQACDDIADKYNCYPTIFEIQTAFMYYCFYKLNLDFAIVEVGMGGETDATNIVKNTCISVFSSIGLDHMQFLGNSLADIARMKSGIIKPDSYVVSIEQEPCVEKILSEKAESLNSKIYFVKASDIEIIANQSSNGICINYGKYHNVKTRMLGFYQAYNMALSLQVINILNLIGYFIPSEAIYQGIDHAFLGGRMECIHKNPDIYLDGAHNIPAMKVLADTVEKRFVPFNLTITYIIGVLADKAFDEELKCMLPYASHILTVKPNNSRALDAEALSDTIRSKGYACESFDDFDLACQTAIDYKDDVILCFGSLSHLADLKLCFHEIFS